jgi:predicted nuclease of predicted toxin-antitoxin system
MTLKLHCSSQQIEKKILFMHKLLFDQNLSYKIVKQIEHLFPNSSHVRLLKLDKADDFDVWQYAKEHGFHIVTQDIDFHDISTLYGYPPKIIRIHTGNTATNTIIELLEKKHDLIHDFLNNEKIGFLELE